MIALLTAHCSANTVFESCSVGVFGDYVIAYPVYKAASGVFLNDGQSGLNVQIADGPLTSRYRTRARISVASHHCLKPREVSRWCLHALERGNHDGTSAQSKKVLARIFRCSSDTWDVAVRPSGTSGFAMPRNIVICSDGAGNTFDRSVSNVTWLISRRSCLR